MSTLCRKSYRFFPGTPVSRHWESRQGGLGDVGPQVIGILCCCGVPALVAKANKILWQTFKLYPTINILVINYLCMILTGNEVASEIDQW